MKKYRDTVAKRAIKRTLPTLDTITRMALVKSISEQQTVSCFATLTH